MGAKGSVMGPDVTAGTTQPCCQPFPAPGARPGPVRVGAPHPGLMLPGPPGPGDAAAAGTRTSRRAGPHAPVAAGVAVAVCDSAASGPESCAPSTKNCGPGLINSS